jgi:hypothetical protein
MCGVCVKQICSVVTQDIANGTKKTNIYIIMSIAHGAPQLLRKISQTFEAIVRRTIHMSDLLRTKVVNTMAVVGHSNVGAKEKCRSRRLINRNNGFAYSSLPFRLRAGLPHSNTQ